MELEQLKDEILSVIMKNCRYSLPLDVAMKYHEVKSFDQLLGHLKETEFNKERSGRRAVL